MNFTEQAPLESLQDVPENSPGLLLDQATLPVGVEPEPLTVASQVVAEPTTTEEGEHDRVAVVYRYTISDAVPTEGPLSESPPYLAVIITAGVGLLPPTVGCKSTALVGVYVTEHAPPTSVHDVLENPAVVGATPSAALLLDHVTLPVGEDPLTAASHVTGDPTLAGDGAHVTGNSDDWSS